MGVLYEISKNIKYIKLCIPIFPYLFKQSHWWGRLIGCSISAKITHSLQISLEETKIRKTIHSSKKPWNVYIHLVEYYIVKYTFTISFLDLVHYCLWKLYWLRESKNLQFTMVVGNKFPEKIILIRRMYYYMPIYKTLVFEISTVYE